MEKKITVINGFIIVAVQLLLLGYAANEIWDFFSIELSNWLVLITPGICVVISLFLGSGLFVLQPNEAVVISFMGTYKGTFDKNGFWFRNPFYGSNGWSLKVSNFAMEPLKVNDKNGVPIEIAAVIVWKVGDTYKAQYEVEDLEEYIDNQFEISLRTLAKNHSYNELSTEEKDFIADLTDKVSKAGVIILDAKITNLNYSSEIAAAMLQKQQATAISEAKEIIVETAVHIAKTASLKIDNMTQEQKAMFISNLILVLCSEKAVSPVVNV